MSILSVILSQSAPDDSQSLDRESYSVDQIALAEITPAEASLAGLPTSVMKTDEESSVWLDLLVEEARVSPASRSSRLAITVAYPTALPSLAMIARADQYPQYDRKVEVSVPAPTAAATRVPEPTAVVGKAVVIYTVSAGDTLGTIAEAYSVSTESLAKSNGLEPPYTIKIGQTIRVERGAKSETRLPQKEIVLPAGIPAYQAAFLRKAIVPAQESERETGIPSSVTIAQAILESDWGRSGLSTNANNYFGIKAQTKKGPAGVVWMDTFEAGVGVVNEPFRAYNDMAESFVDHSLFFVENTRYRKAMAVRDDARQFALEIHRAGYATDPVYSDKLYSYMDRFNLEQYDLSI